MSSLVDSPWKLFILLAIASVFGGLGIPLGYWKNQAWCGFLLGFMLGPLGLLIMLVIPISDEARIRREQNRQRIQAEVARRATAQPHYGQQTFTPSPYAERAQQFPPSPYDQQG